MATVTGKSIQVIRRNDICPSTAAGDNDAHREGGPPLSYELQARTGERARAICYNLPDRGLVLSRSDGQSTRTTELRTGWHYHTCDLQLAFIFSGSIEIAFSDEEWIRWYGGEILVIPDHAPHNARNPSADYSLIEMTFPGLFGTVDCNPAPAGEVSDGFVLADDKFKPGALDGVFEYALAPHVARVADIFLIKSGDGDLLIDAERGMVITVVANGSCELEADGELILLGLYDMVIDEAISQRTRLARRSADFRAYQVRLRK